MFQKDESIKIILFFWFTDKSYSWIEIITYFSPSVLLIYDGNTIPHNIHCTKEINAGKASYMSSENSVLFVFVFSETGELVAQADNQA